MEINPIVKVGGGEGGIFEVRSLGSGGISEAA
jgi:hypothetical protein